ncbi:MAG: hypothetical protein KGS72_20300 [Cyanobacteria bacterium REEB67]|nr:hypothetical protein [Cyanobacteria bacterium REEB67]
MFIERKTAKSVQLTLIDVRDFFSNCDRQPDPVKFKRFARQIYPRVHRAHLGRDILSPEDAVFVKRCGTEGLFDQPLAKGELEGGDRWSLVGRPGLRAYDATYMLIGQLEARILYQLIEDLNVFFQDANNYEQPEQIVLFTSLMYERLAEGLAILS